MRVVRVRTCVQSCACSGVIRRIEGTARASGSREPRQRARRHPQENLPRGALPLQELSPYRRELATGALSLQERSRYRRSHLRKILHPGLEGGSIEKTMYGSEVASS